MARRPREVEFPLTEEDKATLTVLARSRTAAAHHVERAAIILELKAGRSASEVATRFGIDRQRVTRCTRRLAVVSPCKAINDLPRAARPPEITEAARAWLVGEACAKAKDRDYPDELWTIRLLSAHARCNGPAAGHASLAEIAPSTVCKILNANVIKPRRVRYYLESRVPAFDERMAAVVETYGAAQMLQEIPAGGAACGNRLLRRETRHSGDCQHRTRSAARAQETSDGPT